MRGPRITKLLLRSYVNLFLLIGMKHFHFTFLNTLGTDVQIGNSVLPRHFRLELLPIRRTVNKKDHRIDIDAVNLHERTVLECTYAFDRFDIQNMISIVCTYLQ